VAQDERTPGGVEDQDEEFVAEHLGEGRVFRRYGLANKAREQFEIVLRRLPDNVEALRELLDLYRPAGEREALAQEQRVIAEIERLAGKGSGSPGGSRSPN
jgi:hypothetical protein